jgi:hypothetical protein
MTIRKQRLTVATSFFGPCQHRSALMVLVKISLPLKSGRLGSVLRSVTGRWSYLVPQIDCSPSTEYRYRFQNRDEIGSIVDPWLPMADSNKLPAANRSAAGSQTCDRAAVGADSPRVRLLSDRFAQQSHEVTGYTARQSPARQSP